jgi:hypothetical protein
VLADIERHVLDIRNGAGGLERRLRHGRGDDRIGVVAQREQGVADLADVRDVGHVERSRDADGVEVVAIGLRGGDRQQQAPNGVSLIGGKSDSAFDGHAEVSLVSVVAVPTWGVA